MMEGVYQTSRDGRILVANPAFVNLLGYASAEELYQVPAGALYWYPERSRELRAPRGERGRAAQRGIRAAPQGRLHARGHGIEPRGARRAAAGSRGYEGTITDITERKKAETAVFQAKERAQVTLQSIGDAVITTDSEGRIDYMNPVAESLTGWENREAQGQLIGDVLDGGGRDRRAKAAKARSCAVCAKGRCSGSAEHTVLVNRRGQEIAIQDSAAPIRDRAGNLIGAVMVFHDVSKERRLHRALHYQASHDALTGLINRREFENRLTAAVENARQNAQAAMPCCTWIWINSSWSTTPAGIRPAISC